MQRVAKTTALFTVWGRSS